MLNNFPKNKILVVPESIYHKDDYLDIVQPLKGMKTRDWVNKHVAHCLPVVIGNQYGFAIRSSCDFTAEWNGGEAPNDVTIKTSPCSKQTISAHFGSGLITVQNRFTFRTPPGINLMVMNPPNYFIPNLSNMTAVVETDNLRRDFTFNLKILSPKLVVEVKKGDIISAVMPIPRYFVDKFEIELAENYFSENAIQLEQQEMKNAGIERNSSTRKNRTV